MKTDFYWGKADKWVGDDSLVPNSSFGGYNWWLWIPRIRLRKNLSCILFEFSWFCYFCTYYIYLKNPKIEGGQTSTPLKEE